MSNTTKVLLSSAIIASSTIGLSTFDEAEAKSKVEVTQEVSEQTPVQSEHYIDVKNEKIYYNAVIKNPKFKTLIMVHGAGSHAESWGMVTSNFTGDFNYITIDLPGHFRSSGVARKSIEESADFVNDFVLATKDKYKLKNNFTYVGHSLGGAIGVEVGTRHYDWLKSLVLVTTSSDFTKVSSPEFLEGLKNGEMDLTFYERGFSPSSPRAYYDALVSRLNLVSMNSVYADFYSTSLFNDTPKLKKINKETLIVSANDDKIMLPNAQNVLHKGIKHSTLVEVPEAGHFIIMEKPQILASAIQKFVTK